jgi:hypothetical protein
MTLSNEVGKLGELHQRGTLTNDEFALAKARLLRRADVRALPARGIVVDARARHAERHSLRDLLVGGDRRSIARSNDALALILADGRHVGELAILTRDSDVLVVMRAMDLMEKLAHQHPDWVQRYRKLFIGPLAKHESWEIRLQVARALPLLQWTASERKRVLKILLDYAGDAQTFVKVWALDSLARLAEEDPALTPTVERLLSEFESSDSPALSTRARLL